MTSPVCISRLLVEGPKRIYDVVEGDGMPSIRGASERWGRLDRAESEAQDARIARFSFNVRSGSLTTSDGWENARAGCNRSLRSNPSSVGFSSRSFMATFLSREVAQEIGSRAIFVLLPPFAEICLCLDLIFEVELMLNGSRGDTLIGVLLIRFHLLVVGLAAGNRQFVLLDCLVRRKAGKR